MMLRCALTLMETSGTAYCEDHLPHDADILQICPRFQYLGQLHPRPVRGGPAAVPVTTALSAGLCNLCRLASAVSAWYLVAALRFAHAQVCLTACGAQACFVHCCADCRAFTESMPHLFDEATLIEKQRAAEAALRTEEAAAREAADAAAAEAAAAEAEAEEAGRKVCCICRLVAESSGRSMAWQRSSCIILTTALPLYEQCIVAMLICKNMASCEVCSAHPCRHAFCASRRGASAAQPPPR